ncbi:hypothetical protein FRX31_026747 [Thalictrum thalictroides]|uniref:Uncharacterized protein n=1 Tax=Thalictrum thalictroides TaxID=46969 RepID=A0A7J6VEX5_THATH|nr:hypothetical protein FRX31_026747 [Thalictrum thalictroides]
MNFPYVMNNGGCEDDLEKIVIPDIGVRDDKLIDFRNVMMMMIRRWDFVMRNGGYPVISPDINL